MLACFLKIPQEATSRAAIVKFVDRIFLPRSLFRRPEKQIVRVLRFLCLEVEPGSPGPMSELVMVLPARGPAPRHIVDVSEQQLLTADSSWTTAELRVLDVDKRLVSWDQLPAPTRVVKRLQIRTERRGNLDFVHLHFNELVAAGERLALALRLEFRDAIVRTTLLHREVNLRYFLGARPTTGELDDVLGREIPARAWYSGRPSDPWVVGGFDVFVAQRWEHEFVPFIPEPYEKSRSLFRDLEGRRREPPPFAEHIWRMRRLPNFGADPELMAKNVELPIRFLLKVVPPLWLIPVISLLGSVIAAVVLVPVLKRLLGIP